MKGWEVNQSFFLEWEGVRYRLPEDWSGLLSSDSFRSEMPEAANFLQKWFDKADIEQLTSGSTGKPKRFLLDREKMKASAQRTIDHFGLHSKARILVALGLDQIAGKMQLLRAMMAGATVVLVKPSSTPLEDVSGQFAFASMVPMQFEKSLSSIHRIHTVLLGGAPVGPAREKQWLKRMERPCFIGYGMSETYSHIAIRQLGEGEYEAMDGVSFSVGENDALQIHDAVLGLSVATTDQVECSSPTRFRWLGRTDFVINSGGFKLQPEVIENKLMERVNCSLLLIGIDDDSLGEKAVLLIEGQEEPSETAELERALAELNKYERPKELHRVEAFERTWTGKIDRKATKAAFLGGL